MAVVTGVLRNAAETAEMIKLQHTVFALPFALISLVTASGSCWPEPRIWWWVLVAMVGARTAAMTFNRLADHGIDAVNPRTRNRALPAGRLSRTFAWSVVGVSCALFVLAASQLNPVCLLLSPLALAWVLSYSYAKRFTTLAHVWLGVGLGIAPVGAWLAVAGSFAVPPLVLAAAVTCWVAGFDVIYSLKDTGFDREQGLHSLPARLGPARALTVARCLHVVAALGFAVFAQLAGGGPPRWAAVAAAVALLLWQHRLVRPDDLSRVDAAFFTANGVLSIGMCILFIFAKMHPAP